MLAKESVASNLRARFHETREFVSASNDIYSDTVADKMSFATALYRNAQAHYATIEFER